MQIMKAADTYFWSFSHSTAYKFTKQDRGIPYVISVLTNVYEEITHGHLGIFSDCNDIHHRQKLHTK